MVLQPLYFSYQVNQKVEEPVLLQAAWKNEVYQVLQE